MYECYCTQCGCIVCTFALQLFVLRHSSFALLQSVLLVIVFLFLLFYMSCLLLCVFYDLYRVSFLFCTSVRAQPDGNPIALNKYRIVFNVDTSYLYFTLPSHATCKALRKNWNFTNFTRFSCCMYSAQCKNQLIKNNLTCTRIYTQQMKKIIYYSINIFQMVAKFGVYTC